MSARARRINDSVSRLGLGNLPEGKDFGRSLISRIPVTSDKPVRIFIRITVDGKVPPPEPDGLTN